MCGGGGGGSDYSDTLRQQEEERKRRLQQGLQELEEVFAPYYGESVNYTGPLVGEGGDPLTQQQFQSQIQQILSAPPAAGGGTPVEVSAPTAGGDGGPTTPEGGRPPGGPSLADRSGIQSRRPVEGTTTTQTTLPGATPTVEIRPPSTSGSGRPDRAPSTQKALTDAQKQQLTELGLTEGQIQQLAMSGNLDYGDVYQDLRYGEDYYTTEQTGDPAWASVRTDYMDFANPQLERQYESGAEDLTYALARGGQLTGTVGTDRWSDLNQDYALRRQDVASRAEDYANRRRQEILDLEQQYQNMLRTSNDPSLEGTNIEAQLSALSTPPSFESLGPLFQNTTAGLAAGYGGQQAYGTNQAVNNVMSGRGVFSRDPNRSSGRVVR